VFRALIITCRHIFPGVGMAGIVIAAQRRRNRMARSRAGCHAGRRSALPGREATLDALLHYADAMGVKLRVGLS
jgi:hypothetical protein